MHFCAFWQFSKFNVRCNVISMFAKLVFSEICTQKAHLPGCGPSWGSSAGPECAAVRMRRFASRCQSRTSLKVESKSKGHPLPESRMILREKISGKVESDLNYALLLRVSGIYPVILTISYGVLFRAAGLDDRILIRDVGKLFALLGIF